MSLRKHICCTGRVRLLFKLKHSPDYSSISEICSGTNGTDWVFIHSKNYTLYWRIPVPPASITHFLSVWMKSPSFEQTHPSRLCWLACCSSCLTTNNDLWKADLIKLEIIFHPSIFCSLFPRTTNSILLVLSSACLRDGRLPPQMFLPPCGPQRRLWHDPAALFLRQCAQTKHSAWWLPD